MVLAAFLGGASPQALAQTPPQPIPAQPVVPDLTGASNALPMITVVAPQQLEAMPTDAASEQRISGETLNARPIARPSDLLEAVPGLIVSQHSGEGKANQYFLRGMNLDHGTDLALWLDGMPLNMRSHGHAQGYADINFLIPELVQSLTVKKGPYWAEEGDFSSAGTVRLAYADQLEKSVAVATGGMYGYWRALVAGSYGLGNGTLTAAGELVSYNGPWQVGDNTRKFNGFLRYSEGTPDNGIAVTALAYSNSWHSTDQIPARAVLDGTVDRFGAIDQTDGGDTQRYSLSARWSRSDEKTASKIESYFVYSTLNLYNNFTYFLNDPDNGDQFQQSDKRKLMGINASHLLRHDLAGFKSESTLGTQIRYDDISVGLFNTVQRVPTGTIRSDHISETSVGVYAKNMTVWNDWFRSTLGVRGDFYAISVDSNNSLNSGALTAVVASPKAGLVFGPFNKTEFYLNAGQGFHSNDARAATLTVNPLDPSQPQQSAPLLVRSTGGEIGFRSQTVKGLDSTFALFLLDFDSELLFVGDVGTTEPSRPSRRVGIEWTNQYRPTPWALLDLDVAYTVARFMDNDPAGPFIPGAPAAIASAGITLGAETGWFGALRWRFFGARPLVEDGSVYSSPTSLFNARIGYPFENGLKLQADVFNLLNAQANQIDYFYTSRLPGEPAGGIADRHFHPVEPQMVRFTLTKAF